MKNGNLKEILEIMERKNLAEARWNLRGKKKMTYIKVVAKQQCL